MSLAQNENLYRNQVEVSISRLRADASTEESEIPAFAQQGAAPPDDTNETQVIAPNEVDNSDLSYSKDAYLNTVPVGGDAALECYNFYRQPFIRVTDGVISASGTSLTSASNPFKSTYSYPMDFVLLSAKSSGEALVGTLTRVSDNEATLSVASDVAKTSGVLWFGESLAESSARALKASGHSLYAANENSNSAIPRWDVTHGWADFGSSTDEKFDIAAPFPLNMAVPGWRYYFRVIVSRRIGASANSNTLRLAVGVWDDTSTKKRFLEAANITLAGSPVNSTGSTQYRYKVIAHLASGLNIESDVLTIPNGVASLNGTNYNRIQWENVEGILDFTIERETGGVYKEIFRIDNGNTSYNDYGTDTGQTLSNFTSIGETRAIAYAEVPFSITDENTWSTVFGYIDIPPTYDSSGTTSKQWLRIGVIGNVTDARQVSIDRIMFSLSNGGWNLSQRDRALRKAQNPTSTPSGSSQGTTGIDNCITGGMPVLVCDRVKTQINRCPAHYLDSGLLVDNGARGVSRIRKLKPGDVFSYCQVFAENGVYLEATESERFITSRADREGTKLLNLAVGDPVMTKFVAYRKGKVIRQWVEQTRIASIETVEEPARVYTLSLIGAKTFVAGLNNVFVAGKNSQNFWRKIKSYFRSKIFRRNEKVIGGFILHNRKETDGIFLP